MKGARVGEEKKHTRIENESRQKFALNKEHVEIGTIMLVALITT